MKALLLGLDDYRLAVRDLRRLGERPVEISFSLRPPDVKPLFPLAPEERNERLRSFLDGAFERVRSRWPGGEIVPRGDGLPWTSDSVVAARDLPRVLRFPELSDIFVKRIRGLRKRRRPRRLSFYAVRARVAIEVEGQTEGLQSVEDRIVLVRALSAEDAERRLAPEWEFYTEPYLNPDGEMVRWHLEEIVDVYDLDSDEIDPRGTEVYSHLSRRRVRPDLAWHPRRSKGHPRSLAPVLPWKRS
jgi:hypothetical protein